MANPLVSVLIINYQAGPYLVRCLEALAVQTMDDFEAIVVDNGSADGSVELARRAVANDPRFSFDSPGANLGFAAGNNRAAEMARGRWLATLNPDAFARPDWLERLMAATARHPDAAMFGSTQVDAQDPDRLDGCGDQYFFAGIPWRGGFGWPVTKLPPERRVFAPCAAAALYRADAFKAADGFDEDYYCYVEDVDLGFRLRLMGHDCRQISDAVVHHVGGASSGGGTSDFARYHGLRNMVWCFAKNMPGPLLWPLLPFHVAIMILLLIKAAFRGQGRLALSALKDAVAGLPAVLRKRRSVQSGRRTGCLDLMRAMCWTPLTYLRRAPG